MWAAETRGHTLPGTGLAGHVPLSDTLLPPHHEKGASHSLAGPGGESQVDPPTVQGLGHQPHQSVGLTGPAAFHTLGEVPFASPTLGCWAGDGPPSHLSVNHFHSGAVTHSQYPRVGGEVCPTPGRGVPKHKGLRILVDLPKP